MKFPAINVSTYTNLANQLSSVQRIVCGYCGRATPATGERWVCSHCELAISGTTLSIILNDKERVATLTDIDEHMEANDYQSALAGYDKLIAKYSSPELFYNSGLVYMQWSNFQIESIRYDRKGFMEENAKYRESGSALASKAKLMFNRAYSVCQKGIGTAASANDFAAFTWFMSAIKLGRFRNAGQIRDLLKSYNSDYMTSYAEMVLNAELGKYAETATFAVQLLKKDRFSANALYYLSWALFKSGKEKDSLRLITTLGKQLQNNNIIVLTAEMQNAMQV